MVWGVPSFTRREGEHQENAEVRTVRLASGSAGLKKDGGCWLPAIVKPFVVCGGAYGSPNAGRGIYAAPMRRVPTAGPGPGPKPALGCGPTAYGPNAHLAGSRFGFSGFGRSSQLPHLTPCTYNPPGT